MFNEEYNLYSINIVNSYDPHCKIDRAMLGSHNVWQYVARGRVV